MATYDVTPNSKRDSQENDPTSKMGEIDAKNSKRGNYLNAQVFEESTGTGFSSIRWQLIKDA